MRLANDLHRRGYKVHVYWLMERNPELVDEGISQSILARATRYRFRKPSRVADEFGRVFSLVPAQRRRRFLNTHPEYIADLVGNFMQVICDGGRSDPRLLDRLESFILRVGVTHVLPTFAWTCPIVQRVKERGRAQFDYLPTFQGEEIFAHFASRIGRLEDYHRVLRETVDGSPWPAVAVSEDYILRLRDEMRIDAGKLRAIYPGIELPEEGSGFRVQGSDQKDFEALREFFPSLDATVPLVTYLGRQDPEKGVDLLLYAARMLADRGVKLQVACVGGSSFGLQYRKSMEAIAEHLRLTVFWKGRVSNELRGALFRRSRCVVYPSFHREPFGLVAAEAMSFGTPVLVPNLGGITEVIEREGRRGGISFEAWDTKDLAENLEMLVRDDALHAELAGNARGIAEQFSVGRMTDGVLRHLGLGEGARGSRAPAASGGLYGAGLGGRAVCANGGAVIARACGVRRGWRCVRWRV
jgi:glycosyltransferase involved in cell wall biosynthesis